MRRLTLFAAVVAMIGLVALVGCNTCESKPATCGQPQPGPVCGHPAPPPLCAQPAPTCPLCGKPAGSGHICGQPAKAPTCAPCVSANMKCVQQYLPANEKKCAVILLERAAPEWVRVGEEFQYKIRVTNMASVPLMDVVVWDTQATNYRMTKSDPSAAGVKNGWQTWKLGTLAPGEYKLIQVWGVGTGVCVFKSCTEVTYRSCQLCQSVNVVQPSLSVVKTAPSERLLCDTIPIKIVVKNVGSGQACNVMVRDQLPKGLLTMDGKDTLTFTAGSLNPNESREFTAQLKASATGTYVNQAMATADGGLRADSCATTTVVVKPELSVTKTGPGTRFINMPITYTITVVNGPETNADNTVLVDTLPPGVTFVSASDEGKMADNKVTWNLGTMKPRDTKKVTVTVKACQACVLEDTAEVTASCGGAKACAKTTVMGVPATWMCASADPDPVQVGMKSTFTVSLANQGTAAMTNVKLEVVLPPEVEYVDATGMSKASVSGQSVTFEPMTMEGKAKGEYRIQVKCNKAGDVRFKEILTADQLTSPVEHTDSMHIYE